MQVALNLISLFAFGLSLLNFFINLYEKARKLDVCCVTSSPRLKDTDIAYVFNLIISNKSVYPISITKMELIVDDKSYPFIQKTNKSSDCPLTQESVEFPFSLSAYNAESVHVVTSYYDETDLTLNLPCMAKVKLSTSRGAITKDIIITETLPNYAR